MTYKKPIYDITIDEALHLGVDELAFVHDPAIEELFIAMAKEEIIKLAMNEDKMIVTGPVLIPEKLIFRIHPKTGEEYYIRFSAEVIQQIVLRYFTQNKQINFNLEHNKENDVQGVIMESWLVEHPEHDKSAAMGFKMPVGTWMASVKVQDKQFWDTYVKTGLVRGFSIEGSFGQELVEAMNKEELVVEPNSGETEDEFISRCIGIEVGNGYDQEQAAAICYTKWDETKLNELKQFDLTAEEAELLIKEVLMAKESFNDYPSAAVEAAKRALKYKEENPTNNCGTQVGWARARQLANRRPISEETISRMASFARHQQNKDVPYDEGCGGLMWDCWGGTSGIEWAQKKLKQIRNNE